VGGTSQSNKSPVKSLSKEVTNGGIRRFSTFDDLAQWAVDIGRAASVNEIRDQRLDLWGDLVFEWYTQGQIACIFAVNLAKQADKTSWLSAVVGGPINAKAADAVTALVDAAADEKAEVIQLLFPGSGDAAQAARILTVLSQHPRWLCVDVGALSEEPDCGSRQVGLRWISNDRSYESWALGLADFDPTPFTRRFKQAPFVTLVLRPTPPIAERVPPVMGDAGLPAAHLAHLDDRLGNDDATRKKWNEHTRTGKRALLKPDPLSRARAKVTFAFNGDEFDALMADAKLKAKVDGTNAAAPKPNHQG
jgi:hypothetical protein